MECQNYIITSLAFLYLDRKRRNIYFGGITFALTAFIYIINLEWTTPKNSLDVRIVHGNFSNKEKLSRNATIDRFEKFTSLSNQHPKIDLVIWPESSMSFPYQSISKFIKTSVDLLSNNNITAMYGASWYRGTEIINVIMDTREDNPVYVKQRLVPFGEYKPKWFKYLFSTTAFTRGGEMTSSPSYESNISINSIELVSAICFESLFTTTYIDKLKQTDAGVAILISDLEWSPNLWIPRYLLAISRARAMEIERPLIYATNHGVSAFINNNGQIVNQSSGQYRTQILDHSVTPSLGMTPYTKFGNTPLITLIIITIFIAINNHLYLVVKTKTHGRWKIKYEQKD